MELIHYWILDQEPIDSENNATGISQISNELFPQQCMLRIIRTVLFGVISKIKTERKNQKYFYLKTRTEPYSLDKEFLLRFWFRKSDLQRSQ